MPHLQTSHSTRTEARFHNMAIGRVPGATGIQPSIVTAKGDLIVATASGSVTNQAVGTNNQVLMADSAQATGLKYAAEATATLTTTGDLLYASAANTLARRAIGSTGDVLTVSGGVPTWAAPASGGITQITSTTASNNTVTFSSITGTYQHLYIVVTNYLPVNNNSPLHMRFNSSATNYWNITSFNTISDNPATETEINCVQNVRNSSANGFCYIFIPNYSNSVSPKMVTINSINQSNTTAGRISTQNNAAAWNNTAAITSIGFTAQGGNITSGVFTLYGVK